MKKLLLASTAAAVLAAVPANAAHIVFTDRASFDLATGGGLAFESFEAPQSGATVNYLGLSVTESAGTNFITHTAINSFFTGATSDGANSIWYDDNGSSLATFLFDAPINAFGIDIAAAAAGTMTYSGGAGGTFAIGSANTPTFFGFIAPTAFTSVTFDMSGGPEVGFDALSFGTAMGAIPEPTTWAMLIFGFGAIGGAMRKKRKTNVSVSYA